jgi:hypothetical protein
MDFYAFLDEDEDAHDKNNIILKPQPQKQPIKVSPKKKHFLSKLLGTYIFHKTSTVTPEGYF